MENIHCSVNCQLSALTFPHQCNFQNKYAKNSTFSPLNVKFTEAMENQSSDHFTTIDRPRPCNLPFIVTVYILSSSRIFSVD